MTLVSQRVGSNCSLPSLTAKEGRLRPVETFCRGVDIANEWVGRVVSMLFIPLIFIVTMDVVLRYFAHKPTIWAWDINVQLMCALSLLGAGYTLLYKGHVMVDVVVGRFSPRTRAIIDLVTYLVFFFSIGALLKMSLDEAAISAQAKERVSTMFAPPVYPLRIAIAVGFFLILIQGLVKFIRDFIIAIRGEKERLP